MARLSFIVPDTLNRGNALQVALHFFSRGLRFVLAGLVLQSAGQVLMLLVVICLMTNVGVDATEKLFRAARFISLAGVFLGLHGRKKCWKHAVSIRGRWLLVAALVCDVMALVAMLSPLMPALPRVRDAWYLPEIASMALVLVFLARLANVIQRHELVRHAIATLVIGAISFAVFAATLALIPPARAAGVVLPLAALHPIAIVWAVIAVTAATLYGWLLVSMVHALSKFQEELLLHTIEAALSENR